MSTGPDDDGPRIPPEWIAGGLLFGAAIAGAFRRPLGGQLEQNSESEAERARREQGIRERAAERARADAERQKEQVRRRRYEEVRDRLYRDAGFTRAWLAHAYDVAPPQVECDDIVATGLQPTLDCLHPPVLRDVRTGAALGWTARGGPEAYQAMTLYPRNGASVKTELTRWVRHPEDRHATFEISADWSVDAMTQASRFLNCSKLLGSPEYGPWLLVKRKAHIAATPDEFENELIGFAERYSAGT